MQSVVSKNWGALDGLLTEGTQQFSVCINAQVYLGVLIPGMCGTWLNCNSHTEKASKITNLYPP